MSKVLARTQNLDGDHLILDAGYDPATGVYFLDVSQAGSSTESPEYESMFMHPRGLTTYNLTDLATDLERLIGRSLPQVTDAIIELGPVPNARRHLGTL
jgi:hypothetical protein